MFGCNWFCLPGSRNKKLMKSTILWWTCTANYLNPILSGLFGHPISHGEGGAYLPLYLSRKPDALFFCMKVGYHQIFLKIWFRKWWCHHSKFFPICRFFAILKIFGQFFLVNHFSNTPIHHNAITWLCDDIREKDSSDLALQFA